jgi:putative membrane protein
VRRALQTLLALLVAGLIAVPAQALAHPPDLSDQDRKFFEHAAQAGMFEVAKSKIALDRSGNHDVRAFARRMIADHSAQAQQLAQLADKLGVVLPDEVSAEQAALLEQLRGVSDEKFDQAFMKVQVNAHQQAIALFQQEADAGQHPAVRAFAAKGLPVLKDHLQHALKVLNHVS